MKKKAAPKKKAPTKTPDVQSAASVAEVIEKAAALLPDGATIPDKNSRAYLRWFAGLYYASDFNGISVAQMAKHPLFKAVSYEQLAKWGTLDGWVAQREAMHQRVQTQLLEKAADQIVQKRMGELAELKKVADKLLAKLLPKEHKFEPITIWIKESPATVCKICGNPEPGCNDPFWGVGGDKLVTALSKLMELMLTLEGIVLERATNMKPEGQVSDGASIPLEGALSDEEAREAAHAVLRRRNALAAPSRGHAGDGDEDDDEPDASVGDGG